MKNQRGQKSVVLASLCLIGLALALVQCKRQPAPPKETLAVTEPVSAGHATVVPRVTVVPKPTLTAAEKLARELFPPGKQNVYSPDECPRVLETGSSCTVIKSSVRITRPEWEELFPKTDFFLTETDILIHIEIPSTRRTWLTARQDGQFYYDETFDDLLDANNIEITDENYELLAKALALMTIPAYLRGEVIFTEWVESESAEDWYDHVLRAWTEIQGIEAVWGFKLGENRLYEIGMGAEKGGTGDFLPDKELEFPNKIFNFPGD